MLNNSNENFAIRPDVRYNIPIQNCMNTVYAVESGQNQDPGIIKLLPLRPTLSRNEVFSDKYVLIPSHFNEYNIHYKLTSKYIARLLSVAIVPLTDLPDEMQRDLQNQTHVSAGAHSHKQVFITENQPFSLVQVLHFYRYNCGNLSDFAQNELNKTVQPTSIVLIHFFQVLSALKVMHDNGYIHSDIKPRNIFIHKNMYPKENYTAYTAFLGDLGSAVVLQSGSSKAQARELSWFALFPGFLTKHYFLLFVCLFFCFFICI